MVKINLTYSGKFQHLPILCYRLLFFVFAGWQLVEFLRTGIPLVMLQFQCQQLNILLNTHSLLQLISRNIQLLSQTTI